MNLVQVYVENNNAHWIQKNIFVQNWTTRTLDHWIPTNKQLEVLNDQSQYRFVVGGRRVGKTDIIIVDALCNAIRHDNVECIILTRFNNISSIIMKCIEDRMEMSPTAMAKYSKCDRQSLYFTNGSSIKVRKYERLKDANLRTCDYIYIDEAFDILLPHYLDMIIDQNPTVKITAVGTPHTHSRISFGEINPCFKVHHIPVTDPNMIENQRNLCYNEEVYRTNILGEFI